MLAQKVKCFPYGIAPTYILPHKGGKDGKFARLRNKCVMTGYGHAELVSVSPTQLNK